MHGYSLHFKNTNDRDSGDMEHTLGDDWRNKNTETHLLLELQDWLHVGRVPRSVFGDYEQILVELIRIGQQNRQTPVPIEPIIKVARHS